jgi:hypothetical protein
VCQLMAPANPSLRLSYSEFHRLEMKDLVVLANDNDSMITPAQQSGFRNLERYVCLLNSVSDLNARGCTVRGCTVLNMYEYT